MKAKNVLSLNSKEAMAFFMQPEQFHTFELPEYYDFTRILNFVKETIGGKMYEDCLSDLHPEDLSEVNLDILLNKDGHYAVRPLTLANPFLYYFLVREICCQENWATLMDCFELFQVPNITSCALPVVPEKAESFHAAASILNWWNSMEQRSIELSLEYRYMFMTDITNCYGSVIPQSIEWALNCKDTIHGHQRNCKFAENIQHFLRALQHGHNIGIPQGSALFDFIGEIVLGYSDLLLHEALQKEGIQGYQIIRYRDDYRVFCNDRDKLERISYILQSVLERLNLRLNSQKTKISTSIVTDSIKPDKLFYIYNTPIFNKKGCDFDGLQKHLLYILMFSREYPNSGQIRVMLSDIDKRIEEKLKPYTIKVKRLKIGLDSENRAEHEAEKEIELPGRINENVSVLTAIATQIALENVTACHYALRIVSRMINSLKDQFEKQKIIDRVSAKLCGMPNSDYNQLWLQNITYGQDKLRKVSPYTMKLCRLVEAPEQVELWNNNWLKPEIREAIPYQSIVDKEMLLTLAPVIVFRESRAYHNIG